MNKYILYRVALFLSIGLTLFGTVGKIQQWPGAGFLLYLGLMLNLVYIAIGLYLIFYSNEKAIEFKLIWLIGFLVLPWITGLIYYYSEMKPKDQAGQR